MLIQLENNIYNMLSYTKLQSINKHQYAQYNINLNFINIMTITNNFIICIYTNYIGYNIDGFLTEIKLVQKHFKKKILGIYITFFKINIEFENIILNENNKNYNKIISLYNSNIDKLLNMIMQILYTHNIFCYDNSDDVIMIDI